MSVPAAFAAIVGPAHVLTGADAAPFLTDWTGTYSGAAEAVVRPGTTPEVAAVVREARRLGLPITVQGGNTSVSGGSVPGRTGGIVVSMGRMTGIRAIDPAARTATVEAGAVLQAVQEAVAARGLDYPLVFGARGSALIGGTLATNAGGSNVLRYGNARDLCLGIEAVTAEGEILHGLTGLRKDNTGYDLKDLLIGSEGTLGIVTGAVLKLVPTPRVRATAFLALRGLGDALAVLNALQDASGGLVEAFEWLSGGLVDCALRHDPSRRAPLAVRAETGILVELASTRVDDAARGADGTVRLDAILLACVERLMTEGRVLDGTLAASEAQRRALWSLREGVLEAIRAEGRFLSLDFSLPLSGIADFVARAAPLTAAAGLSPRLVGHLGDGNIHYAVTRPGEDWDGAAADAFAERMMDLLADYGGSYSAEHGIGRSKAAVLAARKDPAQMETMRRIKAALDPEGLFNPGVLFAL